MSEMLEHSVLLSSCRKKSINSHSWILLNLRGWGGGTWQSRLKNVFVSKNIRRKKCSQFLQTWMIFEIEQNIQIPVVPTLGHFVKFIFLWSQCWKKLRFILQFEIVVTSCYLCSCKLSKLHQIKSSTWEAFLLCILSYILT